MAEFRKVCDLADLPPGSLKSITVGYDRIVICRTDDRVFALIDECSHDAAPISDGHLETGAVKAPPAVVPIDTYEARIEGNDVLVKLD